jgi:gas vesicle protein
MTTTDPNQIRQEIERTRTELSDDVNALTYKVSPRRVVGERVYRARGAFRGVKERIMGTATDVTDSAGDRLSSTASSVRDAASTVGDKAAAAPQVLREKTEGSPLAAGLVAFGVGLVISSLIPPTEPEQRLAGQVKEKVSEHSDELKEKATRVGQQVTENLREPTRQAVESVKSTVSDATDAVKEQGRSAAQDVKNQAQEAKDNVTNR